MRTPVSRARCKMVASAIVSAAAGIPETSAIWNASAGASPPPISAGSASDRSVAWISATGWIAADAAAAKIVEARAVFRQNLEVLMFADPAKIDALAVHLQAENIKRARFRSRPFAATDGLAVALADITAPLKTIWGRQDIIARPSLEHRLDILRRHHPELAVRLIEGAGHWVAYEAAEAFNAAFLDLMLPSR